MSREIGFKAESIAAEHLQQQGLQLITQNYSTKMGEIDLIMRDPSCDSIVFVEVKYRSRQDYGDGMTSITKSKQRRIIKTATQYLLSTNDYDKVACRFDVISIKKSDHQDITWIPNAFGAN